MSDTDTPRTDRYFETTPSFFWNPVDIGELARRLERELALARGALERIATATDFGQTPGECVPSGEAKIATNTLARLNAMKEGK